MSHVATVAACTSGASAALLFAGLAYVDFSIAWQTQKGGVTASEEFHKKARATLSTVASMALLVEICRAWFCCALVRTVCYCAQEFQSGQAQRIDKLHASVENLILRCDKCSLNHCITREQEPDTRVAAETSYKCCSNSTCSSAAAAGESTLHFALDPAVIQCEDAEPDRVTPNEAPKILNMTFSSVDTVEPRRQPLSASVCQFGRPQRASSDTQGTTFVSKQQVAHIETSKRWCTRWKSMPGIQNVAFAVAKDVSPLHAEVFDAKDVPSASERDGRRVSRRQQADPNEELSHHMMRKDSQLEAAHALLAAQKHKRDREVSKRLQAGELARIRTELEHAHAQLNIVVHQRTHEGQKEGELSHELTNSSVMRRKRPLSGRSTLLRARSRSASPARTKKSISSGVAFYSRLVELSQVMSVHFIRCQLAMNHVRIL